MPRPATAHTMEAMGMATGMATAMDTRVPHIITRRPMAMGTIARSRFTTIRPVTMDTGTTTDVGMPSIPMDSASACG